ncbi:hypothetical protein COO60DRAFT_1636378 [Scenedesmus sp. NREL 46B-D3]|nr:hypothetical protein COO60DRAFT_1636378 [Scenedesmus sp. NREL 46B-D3]
MQQQAQQLTAAAVDAAAGVHAAAVAHAAAAVDAAAGVHAAAAGVDAAADADAAAGVHAAPGAHAAAGVHAAAGADTAAAVHAAAGVHAAAVAHAAAAAVDAAADAQAAAVAHTAAATDAAADAQAAAGVEAAAGAAAAAGVHAAAGAHAADSPTAGMRHSIRQHLRAERQIQQAFGRPWQQSPAQPVLQQQQQKRKQPHLLVAAAVGRVRGAAIAAASQLEDDSQQQAKRMRVESAAASNQPTGTDSGGGSIWQLQLAMPDGRMPCDKTIEQLHKHISVQLRGRSWTVTGSLGVYMAALRGFVRGVAPDLVVPGLAATPQQRQPTPAQAAAVAMQVDKALLQVGRGYTALPAETAASLEEQRAQLAGKAVSAGQQQHRLPLSPQQLQQQAQPALGRPSSSAGSSSGPAKAAAAAAEAGAAWDMELRLPDGRVPCSLALAGVMQAVSKKQPGWELDGQWLVYPPRDTAPKLDTWVKHPSLPAGYFSAAPGADVAVPGLLKQQQQQQTAAAAAAVGKPARAVASAMMLALKVAGGGFVWRGPGSAGRRDDDEPLPAAPAAGNDGGSGRSACAGYGAGYGLGSGYGDMDCLPAGQQYYTTMWRHPPIDREYESPPRGCAVLVLGMVHGAPPRPRRLMQLRAGLGFRVHSFDIDNPEACGHQGLHVQGNFNSTRGARDVTTKWSGVKFSAIFCDYFRMPTGYANEVYKPQLFTQFLPELIRRGAAELGSVGGAFTEYGEITALPGECYPLFKATELAQAAGELQGGYSNATEARQLPEGSEFVVLKCFSEGPTAGGRADKQYSYM